MYHGITSNPKARIGRFLIETRLFAEQMDYLHKQNYQAITVSQLADHLLSAQIPERVVVITFDDAYDNFYNEAFPILARYGFPATLYVPTAYVGNPGTMSWEQLQEVCDQGIELGTHSHSHKKLDSLSPARAYDEIVSCKAIMQQRLNREISSIAYPYGYYSTRVRQLVIEAGYTSACAVRYTMCKLNSDRYLLPRLIVTHKTTVKRFTDLLVGRGSILHPRYEYPRAIVWHHVRQYLHGLKRVLPFGGHLAYFD
jgi:peptidoglycan/xylan/chitin deacetylase (PgdA/CDA1 family)